MARQLSSSTALKSALLFLVLGLLWITFSDRLLLGLVGGDLARYATLQTGKGWLFVVLTTGLVFVLVHRALHRQAEAAREIRLLGERYRRLITHLTVGVFHTDASGALVYLNEPAAQIIGLPMQQALGTGWQAALAPADRDRVNGKVEQAMADGTSFYDEFHFVHRDGSTRHVIGVGRPEYDDDGTVVGYVGTLTDTSERERTLAALRESENRFMIFMEANPAIIWIKDRDGRYVYMNRAWEREFGLDSRACIGKTARDLVATDDAAHFAAIDAEVFASGRPRTDVDDFVRLDGLRRIWETVRFRFQTDDGESCIGGIAVDATEKRLAEARIAELQQRLRLATVAGNIGLWEWDLQRRRAFYSTECKHQLGFSDDEIGDRYAEWESRIHPDDLAATKARLREAVRHPQRPYIAEHRMRHKDGSYRWVLARGRMETDARGKPLRLLGSHTDVTRIKETEKAVIENELRLNHLLAANPTVLYALGIDGNTFKPTWISDSVDRILGYSAQEALEPDWWTRHIHPDDRKRCLDNSQRLLDYEQFTLEYRFLHKNGAVLVVRDESRVLRDADGRATEIIGSWSDITASESERDRLRLYAAAFDNTHDAVLITDDTGTIVAVNPATVAITGYGETDLLGSNARMLQSGRHTPSDYRTLWAALTSTGTWQGEIWNRRKNGEIFPQLMTISAVRNAHGATRHYVSIATDISQIKKVEEQLSYLAHHDALTGLPNRLLVTSRLEHAIAHAARHGERVGVLFIDLDDFKKINDGLGHTIGDELLLAVAKRFGQRVRQQDTLGRLGGDEFLVVLEKIGSIDRIASVAHALRRCLAQPIALSSGHEIHVQASIGISVHPDDGLHADALLRSADTAMYRAKATTGDKVCFFTADMGSAATEQLELEVALRHGIAHGELELFYQPKFVVASGALYGAEALVRWRRADGQLESPARFIPVAERTGLIGPLGEWVIDAACRQQRAWRDAGCQLLPVAVNVSVHQFAMMDLAAIVTAALERHHLQPALLGIEITESAVMEQPERAIAVLLPLQRLGIEIHLDDFGTGFSNLAYLTRLPLDVLKIDASFVGALGTDPAADALVDSVIALAHGIGLEVVAEGVETAAQLAFLKAHGCDHVQGYHLGRPIPAVEFERLLRAAA